jgi:hypothetical protein
LTLYCQEPFAPIEAEGKTLEEPIPSECKLCRYAVTLSEPSSETAIGYYCLSLEYPCQFLPYLVETLCQNVVQSCWFFIKGPTEVQVAAFKGSEFFGGLLPMPRLYASGPPPAECMGLLMTFHAPYDVVKIARQLAWPHQEHWWIVAGLKDLPSKLNSQLLQALQTKDFQLALDSLALGSRSCGPEHRPGTLQRLLTEQAFFLFTMDNLRQFGPFIYTAEPIRAKLEAAIDNFLARPALARELAGSEERVDFEVKPLVSFEYWRECAKAMYTK